MLTVFENLEHCELHYANMGNYTTPLAFSRRLQSLSLTGCLFAKGSTPLADLETNKLSLCKHSRQDIQDCCLSVNNGISELEVVKIGDAEALQVSEMHTVTSLCCDPTYLSAEGFTALFKLPLVRLRLLYPKLGVGTFQEVPKNLVETLELVYTDDVDWVFKPGHVARFVNQFQKLRRLTLFLHPSFEKSTNSIREWARCVTWRSCIELDIVIKFTS